MSISLTEVPNFGEFSGEFVVTHFHDTLRNSKDMAAAVAAVEVLTQVIERSAATTVMELQIELKTASEKLQRGNPSDISLKTACDLFLHYVGRASNVPDFATLKQKLIERGNLFATTSIHARQTIAKRGVRFIGRGSRILVHGFSRVVKSILGHAADMGVDMHVIVTEGRPDNTGRQMIEFLTREKSVPCTVVLDSGVAYIMDRVDMVLVGAGGVAENGGIISKLGTYQIALCARALGKPFYVAAESYKFTRLYPLDQADVPKEHQPVDFAPLIPKSVKLENPSRDFTPPELISLLFTDLGVLTPAAVSDELIQMYGDPDASKIRV